MNSDVEFAVVGVAIKNPEVIPEVLSKIVPADLWDPKAETVLTAVAALWSDGIPVDALSVRGRLAGSQVDAGDLFRMIEGACVPASLSHHLKTILEAARLRRLGDAGQRILTLAQAGESADTITQQAQELLDNATRADESEVHRVGETMGSTIENMRAVARGEVEPGIPTGFRDLDELTNGLSGGQMIVIGGRPGSGKTTAMVDMMRHASISMNIPTLMFSLEMGADEVNQRILAAESSTSLTGIVKANLSDSEWSKIEETQHRIEQAPMFIDASPEITITDIVAKARMHVKQYGVKAVYVDYIQLLRSKDKQESREQEVAAYSRQMKLLAKSCGVPVVVAAQLNRDSIKRGGAPMVSDLRESGSLEQDADLVILIDRPENQDPNDPRAGEADLLLKKNRRGPTGTATVISQLKYSRFSDFGNA